MEMLVLCLKICLLNVQLFETKKDMPLVEMDQIGKQLCCIFMKSINPNRK